MRSTDLSQSHPKPLHSPSPASSLQNSVIRDISQSDRRASPSPNSHVLSFLNPSKNVLNEGIKSTRQNAPLLQKHRSSLSMSSAIHYNPKVQNEGEVSFAQKHFFQPGFDSRSNASFQSSTEKSSSFMPSSLAAERAEYKLPLKPIVNTSRDMQQSSYYNNISLPTGSPTSLASQNKVSPLSGAESLGKSSQFQESHRLAFLNTILSRRGSGKENGGPSLDSSIGLGASLMSKGNKGETSSAAAVRAMKALQEKLAKSEAEVKQLKEQLGNNKIEVKGSSRAGEIPSQTLTSDHEALKEATKKLNEENMSLKKQLNSYRKALEAVNQENQAMKKDKAAFEAQKQAENVDNSDNQEVLRTYAEGILKKLDFERKKSQGLEEQLFRLYKTSNAQSEDYATFQSQRSVSNDRQISQREKKDQSAMKKRTRNLSETGESQSQRIDYKVRAETLERENLSLRDSNSQLLRTIEKLDKKIAVLKISKEKIVKDNIEKKELFNQVVEVNRELISKLSENFKYADLRDVLSKMAKIENSLQRKKSPNTKHDQSFTSISPKYKSHRSYSATDLDRTFNQSVSSVSYRKAADNVPPRHKPAKNKDSKGSKAVKKNKSYMEDTSNNGKNRSFYGSHDGQSFLRELNSSKGHKKNLLS